MVLARGPFLLIACFTTLAIVIASPLATARTDVTKASHHVVKQAISPPRGWVVHGDPSSKATIALHVFLPQPNFHHLESALYEISDPDHSRYGQHLSKEEVDSLVAPHPESVSFVDEWLESHDISLHSVERSHSNDSLLLKIPLSKAEEMLQTTYHVWRHVASGDTLIRTTQYSLPASLHKHIDLIQPSTSFSRMRPTRITSHWEDADSALATFSEDQTILANGQEVDVACNTSITVSCIRQLYNAVGIEASGKHGNEIGITGYLGESANVTDFQLFLANETTAPDTEDFKVVLINGGLNNESRPGGEATLDVQFAFGVAAPTPATFWSTGGSPPFIPDEDEPTNDNEPYADWIQFVLSQPKIPQTISTSYGEGEQTVPINFARRVCNGFAQITARGTTLLFSSGDGGVGDGDSNPATQDCFTNDGTNQTKFVPTFPAGCPFVTAVGATRFVPEHAVGFSGGGFSNFFSRPPFQEQAVTTFLKKLPKGTYEGLFNPNGRGFPDVSLQGVNFRIFFRGNQAGISGTSASSPGFAGLVSLINDARLSRGLPSLGWLNPLIYKTPSAFNDITVGNNPGCGTEGFNATEGWDPISGLGTPDVRKLMARLGCT